MKNDGNASTEAHSAPNDATPSHTARSMRRTIGTMADSHNQLTKCLNHIMQEAIEHAVQSSVKIAKAKSPLEATLCYITFLAETAQISTQHAGRITELVISQQSQLADPMSQLVIWQCDQAADTARAAGTFAPPGKEAVPDQV